jgi:hypothetical protein
LEVCPAERKQLKGCSIEWWIEKRNGKKFIVVRETYSFLFFGDSQPT